MKAITTLCTLLFSGAALAHGGHGLDQAVHGILHGEHLLVLALAGVVTWLIMRRAGK